MADDEKKSTDDPLAWVASQLLQQPNIDFSSLLNPTTGAAFDMNPQDYMPKALTMEERFYFASTEAVIKNVVSRINAAHAQHQGGGALVVTMRTPDGGVMDVESLWAEGFSTFRADGYINGMPCSIIGHVSTLNLFYAFEERKGKARVGFRTDTVPTTEPRPEPEQTKP